MAKREFTELDDVVARKSMSVGQDLSITIPEDQFPTSVAFRADERIDWIDRVDVKVRNSGSDAFQGTVEVELFYGTGSDGELIESDTKTLSVDGFTTIQSTFLSNRTQVVDGPYYVSISPENPLEIVRTDVETLGSTVKREKQSNGDEVWYDEKGNERGRIHANKNVIEFPQMDSALHKVTDSSSDPQAPGEITNDGGNIKVHTGGGVKSLTSIGSGGTGDGASTLDGLTDYYEGTLSDRPNATEQGRLYVTTDENGIFRDTGSEWKLVVDHPSNIQSGVIDSIGASDVGAIPDEPSSVTEDHLSFDPSTEKKPRSVVSVSSDHIASYNEIVLVDASSNGVNVTLPAPDSGSLVDVKAIDATSQVTIETPGSQSIDGEENVGIGQKFASLTIASDGNNYYII